MAVPTPSAQQTAQASTAWEPAQDGGSLLKMAAAGRAAAPAPYASLTETRFHRNSENSLLSPADNIPAKPRRPLLFSLWGRICTLELNLEPLHSDQRMKLFFVSEPTLVSVYWLQQHGARGSLSGTISVGGWVTELLPWVDGHFPWHRASLVGQLVTNPPAVREAWVPSLGWEDPLEEGMATHSSILAWRIPMDRRAWQDAVHGVAKNQTQLSN